MFALDFINFLFGLVMVIFTIIIFHPINKFKKLTVKEDQLFLQKTLITTIFYFLIIVISIMFLFLSKEYVTLKKVLYLIELFAFNFYVVVIVILNFCMSYELYSTFMNPVHYFNRLFKQHKYNYIHELITYIISIIVLITDIYLFFDIRKYKIIYSSTDNKDVDKYKFEEIFSKSKTIFSLSFSYSYDFEFFGKTTPIPSHQSRKTMYGFVWIFNYRTDNQIDAEPLAKLTRATERGSSVPKIVLIFRLRSLTVL